MCTRFYIEAETEELKALLSEVQNSRLSNRFIHTGSAVLTSGEIRPTNVVPVLATGRDGKKNVFPMRWGFQIPGGSLLLNARSETAAQKPTFQEAWRKHRCIIPSLWYYEWEHFTGNMGQKKTGDKFLIQSKGSKVTWLAGLYRIEEGFPVFAVLTREPTGVLKRIHDRMPLIFETETVDRWICPDSRPEELLPYAKTDMVVERVP